MFLDLFLNILIADTACNSVFWKKCLYIFVKTNSSSIFLVSYVLLWMLIVLKNDAFELTII